MKRLSGLLAAIAVGGALTVTAEAATVSFYNVGVDNEALSTGERFDITCYGDAAKTIAASCAGALIDVAGLTSNLFDTNAANGLVGDMTNNGNVDTPDPGTGVSPAEELLFVQNYVGNPALTWTAGVAGTTSGGGASAVSFASNALYLLFTIGNDPRYGLLRNDSASRIWVDFLQIGQGAGLSHYAEFGRVRDDNTQIPLPAAGFLLLGALGALGGVGAWRRRQTAA